MQQQLAISFLHGRRALVLALAAALGGCAAGPDYQRPAAPAVPGYTATPLPQHTAAAQGLLGEAQHWQMGAAVPLQWWRALGAPRLDAWIAQALEASPTLASAQAALRQAQELQAAQAASTRYPQVDAGLGAQRQRQNGSALAPAGGAAPLADVYSASLGVRYRFDLAGGDQQARLAWAARTDYRRHQLHAARLALAANLTSAALARARQADQWAAMQALLQAQDEQLALAHQRLRLGSAGQDELLALQAQVERTRSDLALLRKQVQHSEHLLAVLAGQAPGTAAVPDFSLAEFRLPVELPVRVPSELVRHRPDILAAEALLQAATADYGVAAARLYPQIQLSASLGSQALTTGALFGGGSAVWGMLAQLTQPLFNPALPAEKRAALAALDAAAASYQAVVLDALREVADALGALEHDAQARAALAASDAAAQAVLQSMERQYALGAAGYVQLLLARQQAQQSRLGLIGAQAQRLADSAALYQAMGGGDAPPEMVVSRADP